MPDHIPCHRCGAGLTVGPTARFVTCNRCGAELAVQRTPSAVFTEAMADGAGEPANAPSAPPCTATSRGSIATGSWPGSSS